MARWITTECEVVPNIFGSVVITTALYSWKRSNFQDPFMDSEVVAEDIGAINGGGEDTSHGVVILIDIVDNAGEDHRGCWVGGNWTSARQRRLTGYWACRDQEDPSCQTAHDLPGSPLAQFSPQSRSVLVPPCLPFPPYDLDSHLLRLYSYTPPEALNHPYHPYVQGHQGDPDCPYHPYCLWAPAPLENQADLGFLQGQVHLGVLVGHRWTHRYLDRLHHLL